MNVGPRHHAVSRGYLRAWLPPGERRRVRARVLPNKTPKLISIRDVCVYPHWNSMTRADGTRDPIYETLLARDVEGPTIPKLRQFASTGRADDDCDRCDIAILISTLSVCGQTVREQLRSAGVAMGEEYLRDHPDSEEAVRWEQNQHDNHTRSIPLLFDEIGPCVASILASMHWRVLRDLHAGFATADQPVIWYDGTHQSTAEPPLTRHEWQAAFFALSPRELLVGSWLDGPDYPPTSAPAGLADWFNGALHRHAYRHFIDPPERDADVTSNTSAPGLDITVDPVRLDRAWKGVRATGEEDERRIVHVRPEADHGYQLWAYSRSP